MLLYGIPVELLWVQTRSGHNLLKQLCEPKIETQNTYKISNNVLFDEFGIFFIELTCLSLFKEEKNLSTLFLALIQ